MNANKCLGRVYPHAAEVCIVLEVFSFQKLVDAKLNLSTEFSTGEVEMFTKLSAENISHGFSLIGTDQKAEDRKQKAKSGRQKAEGRLLMLTSKALTSEFSCFLPSAFCFLYLSYQ
ncbi:MAG TPA: hypothetical protein VE135_23875 [Pyrinomonadaceae bacterium]|nr:hypothetical protein [Pyrinomonadaceae bacterium]